MEKESSDNYDDYDVVMFVGWEDMVRYGNISSDWMKMIRKKRWEKKVILEGK